MGLREDGLGQVVFGTGLTATITFSDKREHEVMSALAHYSAGLCRIE